MNVYMENQQRQILLWMVSAGSIRCRESVFAIFDVWIKFIFEKNTCCGFWRDKLIEAPSSKNITRWLVQTVCLFMLHTTKSRPGNIWDHVSHKLTDGTAKATVYWQLAPSAACIAYFISPAERNLSRIENRWHKQVEDSKATFSRTLQNVHFQNNSPCPHTSLPWKLTLLFLGCSRHRPGGGSALSATFPTPRSHIKSNFGTSDPYIIEIPCLTLTCLQHRSIFNISNMPDVPKENLRMQQILPSCTKLPRNSHICNIQAKFCSNANKICNWTHYLQ